MRQSICVEHLVNRMGSIEYFITPHSVDPIRLTTHISTHAQVLGHNLASGGCQPTELPAFDSEGLHPPLAGFAANARRQSPDTAILQSIVMPQNLRMGAYGAWILAERRRLPGSPAIGKKNKSRNNGSAFDILRPTRNSRDRYQRWRGDCFDDSSKGMF